MASSEAAGNPLIVINLFFGLSSSNEEQNHQNLTHSFFSVSYTWVGKALNSSMIYILS